MKKRLPYIIICVLLIAVEVVIALTQHDNWLRYYGGDIIVMWVVYCFAQGIICTEKRRYAVHFGALAFAFLVELLQKINIVELIGLGNIEFFRVLIGTSFSVNDLLCYAVGTAVGSIGTAVWNCLHKRRDL